MLAFIQLGKGCIPSLSPQPSNPSRHHRPIEFGFSAPACTQRCAGELLEHVGAPPGQSLLGEAVQEARAAWDERLVAEGLEQLGWSEANLQARRKGEPMRSS